MQNYYDPETKNQSLILYFRNPCKKNEQIQLDAIISSKANHKMWKQRINPYKADATWINRWFDTPFSPPCDTLM